MKKGIFGWMGNFEMGIFLMLLAIFCAGWIIAPVIAQDVPNDDSSNEKTRGSEEPDIWYIYTSKKIVENISIELPIVINSSGELRIRDSATFELLQKYDHQRNITIKNNGTLRIQKGTLQSNYALNICLEDNGKLIIEKSSELKASEINARNNAVIQVASSVISPGVGGLVIDIGDESSLELTDSSIINANKINAYGDSKLVIKQGFIDTDEFAISCKELSLISNPDFRDLKINSCKNIIIKDSKVTGLQVSSCGNLYSYTNTTINDSTINSLGSGKLSSAKIQKLSIDSVDELELDGCNVNILKINEMVTDLKIRSSVISQLDIENCQNLETYDTHFDNSELRNSLDIVVFHSSTVEHCSIFPLAIKIYDSTIIGNEAELNDLTRGRRLDAYNSSFNAPLHFTGTSEAYLINCSTLGENPPKVIVEEDAKIYIYWWLEVQVLDNKSKPLPDVTVTVCDFITNARKEEGISDQNGQVKFALLANTIMKSGWNTKNNKSYFVKGQYNGHSKENETGIWMRENTKSYLEFKDVKPEKAKPKPLFTAETITGILIFIVIIILIALSLVSGKKPNKPKNPNRNKNGNNGIKINNSDLLATGKRKYASHGHGNGRVNKITVNRRLKTGPRSSRRFR